MKNPIFTKLEIEVVVNSDDVISGARDEEPRDEKQKDISEKVVSTFINSVASIEAEKEIPDFYDTQMLEIIKKIGNKRNKYFSDITIVNYDYSAVVSPALEKYTDKLIGEDRKMYGSIVGMLEQMNIHNNINKFFIYPSVGANRIECNFPMNLKIKAISAMARFVKVKGKLKYRSRDSFPYQIYVDEIEIYPHEEDLPTLKDLRGTAPDMTGDKSTLDFIRSIREDNE